MALLCLNFWALAQEPNPIKPLKVGDKLPESFWQQEHMVYHNGKTTKQTLAAYKGKLLILDFWATWCGSCIKKFAFADSLQSVHRGQLSIVLVNAVHTKDTPEKIGATMESYGHGLYTTIGDNYLKELFPHKILPHYIWIEAGQFVAATGSDFFTTGNIAACIERLRANKGKVKGDEK